MRKEFYSVNEGGTGIPAEIRAGDADSGPLFPWKLEYNCPAHEHWNIVHTGMLIPEVHQIYICPDNCLRGVVMTALEMGAADRLSSVVPNEAEVIGGKLEQVTVDGVTDVLNKLPRRPRAVQIFPVCMHHFTGCDMRYIFRTIRERFPDIDVMECFMDPIMQKLTTTPEMRQRWEMMRVLPEGPEDRSCVSVLGEDLRMRDSDFKDILEQRGIRVLEVQDCGNYDEYLAMGRSFLYVTRSAFSRYGLENAAKKNGRRALYLPPASEYGEIDRQLVQLVTEVTGSETEAEQWVRGYSAHERELTEEAFRTAREKIGDTPITICIAGHPRPLGFARILLEHGFQVKRVYLDAVSAEEEADFGAIRAKYPDLVLQSTSLPAALQMRERQPGQENAGGPETLAIGPKAAYFTGSSHFVNCIEADGGFGYHGIRHLLDLMVRAMDEKKNNEIVTGKGLGLPGVWPETCA